jgi:capsular exopolysaccharide synthesis family protein
MPTVNITFPFENHYFINEAFNALSTNVRFSGPDIKVITLTSCFENEGKSSIVFTLAKHLASEQKRVLLLDADMRNSVAVSKFSDLTDVNGLSELISGMAPLEDVLYHSNVPGLDVIFSGAVPPNPVALLGHAAFATLVKSLSEQYDYVLIDTPPLTPVIDAALTAAVSDGSLLIVNRRTVRRRNLLGVKNQLEKTGCPIIGVILNDASRARAKRGFSLISRLFSSRKK